MKLATCVLVDKISQYTWLLLEFLGDISDFFSSVFAGGGRNLSLSTCFIVFYLQMEANRVSFLHLFYSVSFNH